MHNERKIDNFLNFIKKVYIEICNLTVYNTKKISYLQFKLSENLIFYEEYY